MQLKIRRNISALVPFARESLIANTKARAAVSSVVILTLALSFSPLVESASAGWRLEREVLDQRLEHGEYRVYYTLEGADAFPAESVSGQRQRVEPLLEALVAQIDHADYLYRVALGLKPPLQSSRYQGATGIDIHIFSLKGKMGSSGDELQRFRYQHFGAVGPVLVIDLSHHWSPPNLTPSHEIFHAYQYSYTFFKNRWFLEGMARSVENIFQDKVWRDEPLPGNTAELRKLLARSYGADLFWNRLARLCDMACSTTTKEKGGAVCGAAIIRPLLEQYGALDRVAARDRGLRHWPENEQRSVENTPYLLLGLMRVVEERCPVGEFPELGQFLEVLKANASGLQLLR